MNMLDLYFSRGVALQQPTVSEIIATNKVSKEFGLILRPEDACVLIEERNRALVSLGRVETGVGLIAKIINSFCNSPYINSAEYVQIVGELVEIFYNFKNETDDQVPDDELIEIMCLYYNGSCKGSLELLKDRELVSYVESLRKPSGSNVHSIGGDSI